MVCLDLNPGPQNGRRRRNHGAMVATQHTVAFYAVSCCIPGKQKYFKFDKTSQRTNYDQFYLPNYLFHANRIQPIRLSTTDSVTRFWSKSKRPIFFSKIAPKMPQLFFPTKSCSLPKLAQKVTKYLGYFCRKSLHQEVSKIKIRH